MTAAEKIIEKLKAAPPDLAEEVLDFFEFLETRHRQRSMARPVKLEDFFGVLKDLPVFSEDPVALQRKLRDEWR